MSGSDLTIFTNGKIFTSNVSMPEADAMAVQDGRVVWIGRGQDLPFSLTSRPSRTVDLKDRRVIPGFVDAHMHPVMLADLRKQITAMPPKIRSIEDLVRAIRSQRQQQGPGQWIEGWGYDEQGLAEKRSPNRYDLDRGCADAPVSIMRTCAHIRCVNSMALKLAGIDRNTPDPPGGEIERDASGEPTGILKENARNLLAPLLPIASEEQKVANLLELGELLTSQGITAICDMGNLDASDNYPIYMAAAEKGFRQKTGIYYMWDFFADDPAFTLPAERMDRNRQIFAAGLKLIGDGSISGRTAWMDRPYKGSDDDRGICVCSDALMESAIDFCKKNRCQLSMHAMGSRAIRRMIDRACLETPWTPEGIPYVRIEHVTEPSEESIRKAASHGIAFVTQPIFLYAESASYVANLGAERTKQTYPFPRLLNAGVLTGFSTDAPATFWAVPSDPFPGLALSVTRRAADGTDCGAQNRVAIADALRLYTVGSARAAGFPNAGMLAPGYAADFAVLSDDILAVPSEAIHSIRVIRTYIGGECVYSR